MRKNRIRLSESQLHRVIKESVKRVLRESNENVMKKAKRWVWDNFDWTSYQSDSMYECHEIVDNEIKDPIFNKACHNALNELSSFLDNELGGEEYSPYDYDEDSDPLNKVQSKFL